MLNPNRTIFFQQSSIDKVVGSQITWQGLFRLITKRWETSIMTERYEYALKGIELSWQAIIKRYMLYLLFEHQSYTPYLGISEQTFISVISELKVQLTTTSHVYGVLQLADIVNFLEKYKGIISTAVFKDNHILEVFIPTSSIWNISVYNSATDTRSKSDLSIVQEHAYSLPTTCDKDVLNLCIQAHETIIANGEMMYQLTTEKIIHWKVQVLGLYNNITVIVGGKLTVQQFDARLNYHIPPNNDYVCPTLMNGIKRGNLLTAKANYDGVAYVKLCVINSDDKATYVSFGAIIIITTKNTISATTNVDNLPPRCMKYKLLFSRVEQQTYDSIDNLLYIYAKYPIISSLVSACSMLMDIYYKGEVLTINYQEVEKELVTEFTKDILTPVEIRKELYGISNSTKNKYESTNTRFSDTTSSSPVIKGDTSKLSYKSDDNIYSLNTNSPALPTYAELGKVSHIHEYLRTAFDDLSVALSPYISASNGEKYGQHLSERSFDMIDAWERSITTIKVHTQKLLAREGVTSQMLHQRQELQLLKLLELIIEVSNSIKKIKLYRDTLPMRKAAVCNHLIHKLYTYEKDM